MSYQKGRVEFEEAALPVFMKMVTYSSDPHHFSSLAVLAFISREGKHEHIMRLWGVIIRSQARFSPLQQHALTSRVLYHKLVVPHGHRFSRLFKHHYLAPNCAELHARSHSQFNLYLRSFQIYSYYYGYWYIYMVFLMFNEFRVMNDNLLLGRDLPISQPSYHLCYLIQRYS